ncbi:MAG TPA: alpha/beta fold hydrolase [Steroidobacteraceae bacterium]|nr:alpha/beta fold hydrolase [Steroidobacteraceae bacterium]
MNELNAGFRPPSWLANRHLQSVLPSLPLRRGSVERRAAPVVAASRRLVLDCGEGVRLMGWLADPPPEAALPARRLALLLHGWEGSSESLYVLSVAQLLHERGITVLRLNLRDHGGTHALNEGLFHSCRIAEVLGAVARVQALYPDASLALAGFSLGGNFWLRVGARAAAAGIRIGRIVAVCPVLDPATTLAALEQGPAIYRQYFLLKWRRSLRAKQQAWPGTYDFGELLADPSLTAMTERMVLRYAGFPDLASYLRGYAITGPVLESLAAPTTIITSRDDPMILAHDLERLARPQALRLVVTERGGHCGYMDALGGPSWIDRAIVSELAQ